MQVMGPNKNFKKYTFILQVGRRRTRLQVIFYTTSVFGNTIFAKKNVLQETLQKVIFPNQKTSISILN